MVGEEQAVVLTFREVVGRAVRQMVQVELLRVVVMLSGPKAA